MKLETFERFVNKTQDEWNKEDLDKLLAKFGRRELFYRTDGITNKIVGIYKHRDILENDKKIIGFIEKNNGEFIYVKDFIKSYIDVVDYILWPAEISLHVIYKIFLRRIKERDDSKEDIKNDDLIGEILDVILNKKLLEENKKEDINE